jgi:hypothetical protein
VAFYSNSQLENRLQRDQTAQQLWAYAACNLRRFESPVNWRFKAKQQNRSKDQLTLHTSDFWNLDYYGKWGQVTMAGAIISVPQFDAAVIPVELQAHS